MLLTQMGTSNFKPLHNTVTYGLKVNKNKWLLKLFIYGVLFLDAAYPPSTQPVSIFI